MAEKNNNYIYVQNIENPEYKVRIEKLTLNNPIGRGYLVKEFDMALKPGERFVLTGPSGSGKSTVIRAMRGLWLDGNGKIEIDQNAEVLCLSQETHIPRGDLRRVLTQPLPPGAISDDEIADVLKALGLDKLLLQLPKVQANPCILGKTAGRYIPLVERQYGHRLGRLNEGEREKVFGLVKEFVQENAQDFYPAAVAEFLVDETKVKLAESICENLEDLDLENTGKPSLFSFPMRKEKLAREIARMLLQGSALELQYRTKNGSQLGHELSGGEQQKLNIARALLLKPDLLIMDEPTSKMDPVSKTKVYELLTARLQNTTFFGVVHDAEALQYYDYHGHLKDQVIQVRAVNATDEVPLDVAADLQPTGPSAE